MAGGLLIGTGLGLGGAVPVELDADTVEEGWVDYLDALDDAVDLGAPGHWEQAHGAQRVDDGPLGVQVAVEEGCDGVLSGQHGYVDGSTR